MSRYNGEQVLVIPRATFDATGPFQGYMAGDAAYLSTLIKPGEATFMDRELAEQDPSHKQIIAYAIFAYQGRILHYTRGNSGGESRLHDKISIGIGGHINPIDSATGDITPDTYMAGVAREISEELVINGHFTQRIIGAINDDDNEVGKVHLGIVHLFELDSHDVRSGESALANLSFITPDELAGELAPRLETWSTFALALYRNSLNK